MGTGRTARSQRAGLRRPPPRLRLYFRGDPGTTQDRAPEGGAMNNVRKALTVLVAGAALAVVPLTPSMASAAPTDPEIASGCDFALVSIKARNLRHDGATDFVFVKLDRTFFPAGGDGIPFKLGDKRPASDFGNPTMGFWPAGLNVAVVTEVYQYI